MKTMLSVTAVAAAILLTAQAQAAPNQTAQATPTQGTQGTQNNPAAGTSAQNQNAASSGSSVSRPGDTQSMSELRRAAQSLRKAVQAMAQQPAGERRNQAMEQAREALLQTQQAMVQLPLELRKTDSYREAQQHAGEAQANLNGREPNQQNVQQSVDRLLVVVQGLPNVNEMQPRHASSLLEQNLIGANNNDVADVQDLLIDNNWRVRGVVVEWGGFLGLGERRAVVPVERITMSADGKSKAKLNMTREELEKLPAYKGRDN